VEKRAGVIGSLDELLSTCGSKSVHRFINIYKLSINNSASSIPRQEDFQPEMMGEFLADMAIIGFDPENEPVFRLVGVRVRENFHLSPVGQRYRSFVPEIRAESAVGSFLACRDHRCGMFVQITKTGEQGKILHVDVLGLPLVDNKDGRTVDRMVMLDSARVVSDWDSQHEEDLTIKDIRRRDFIDLGFGVPENHIDLARA
jgi:hypothetical protein